MEELTNRPAIQLLFAHSKNDIAFFRSCFQMFVSVSAERLRKLLVALTVFTVGLVAILYWGRLQDLQNSFKSSTPR